MPIILDGVTMTTGMMTGMSTSVFRFRTDLYGWFVGTNGGCTIARDTSTGLSPNGGIPLLMSITGNDPYMATYNAIQYNLGAAASGQTWTASMWVKSSVATTGEVFLFGDTNAGGQVFTLNDYGAGAISITTSWTQVSYSRTFTNAGTQQIQCRLDGTNSGGAGINIWWDGLQVYRVS
jgi:hypothetical protein